MTKLLLLQIISYSVCQLYGFVVVLAVEHYDKYYKKYDDMKYISNSELKTNIGDIALDIVFGKI